MNKMPITIPKLYTYNKPYYRKCGNSFKFDFLLKFDFNLWYVDTLY